MIVGVLTTCHTQYIWERSICIFYLTEQHSKLLLHTLQVLYMCILCDSTNNTLREEEEHKPDPWRNAIERNHMGLHLENEVAIVKTSTIISNNPVYIKILQIWGTKYSGSRSGVDRKKITTLAADLLLVTPPPPQPPPPTRRKLQPVETYSYVQHQLLIFPLILN